ncbi:MAG: TolC family protein [Gemmatimonadota bacterium]
MFLLYHQSHAEAHVILHSRHRRLHLARRTFSAFALLSSFVWPFVRAEAQQSRVPVPRDTARISLPDALTRALRANPELAATRLDIAVAQGQLRQARLIRSNPSADFLTTGSSGTRPEIGLSQEIEIGGQRGRRVAVANAGVARARLGTANATRVTLADVERDFYRIVAAGRRAALADEVLALNERLAQVAVRQLREGEISKLDYNLTVIELGRSRSQALGAHRDQESASLEFRRLVGIATDVVVVPVYDSLHRHARIDSARGTVELRWSTLATGRTLAGAPATDTLVTLDGLLSRAISQRPDLAERDAAISEAQALVSLSRREALPNLLARVVVEQSNDGGRTAIRPGIGMSLPVFNRQQGETEARRAAASQAMLDRVATATRVRVEVEQSYRAYEAAATAVEVLESTVLGPARDNRRLLEAAYREGKVGLPVLLLIRNQVIGAEQDYWTAWLAEREALAELAAAIGLGRDEASVMEGVRE